MLIQVFTHTRPENDGFRLLQDVYYDYSFIDTRKGFVKTDNPLLADAYNVGYAMKYIAQEDYTFNTQYTVINGGRNDLLSDKKAAYNRTVKAAQTKTGKRFAVVYTPNELVHQNIKYSIRTIELTKVFQRIIELKNECVIGLVLREHLPITQDEIKQWKQTYKDNSFNL